MRRTRTLALSGAALAAVATAQPVRADTAPEADLAYHGSAVMAGARIEVRLTAHNQGPAAVPGASVRLRWSVPPAERQTLPDGCVRTAERDVVCATGPLPADGFGERIALDVGLRERGTEVTMEIDTVWSGGTVDRDRTNDRTRVLILDTGDAYPF
ncbi:hypothetical protein AB0F77_38170 [Streptomyces sp. NPDC026672]|uniref:hypothetical protein n=1 Tax=unclassified Streptomyces TaxID=2593676 RepID=UPI0033F12C31